MFAPLKLWLKRTRRVRNDTIVVPEFSWMGRRIDLATLTSSGISTSYELKLYKNLDAIEQAAHNALVFDRSYVVTATPPKCKTLDIAVELKVGMLVLASDHLKVVVRAPMLHHSPIVTDRLRRALRQKVK